MSQPISSLHIAARAEDLADRWIGALARRRGWRAAVTASTGYGTPQLVHLFARVLLAPTRTSPERAQRGWRSLMTLAAAGHDVRIRLDGEIHELRSDRGGYVHASLETDLVPGWHEASIEIEGRPPVLCRLRVVDPEAPRGVVCDIDDTVLVTWVPRPLLAAWNSFFLREHARRPVPGMAPLLRALAGDDAPLVYLSTGAWNFAPHLERFMAEHGLPAGPLILTDWGPTPTGWFRSGEMHKREILERLRNQHPHTRWVLVGDDGQRDPAVYAAFAEAHPDAVDAIAIRQLTPAQQILARPAALEPSAPVGPRRAPTVHGADGHELFARLAAEGVIAVESSG